MTESAASDNGDDAPFRPLARRRRRFVVVVDDSPECHVAIRFASGRAAHVDGGVLVLFHVIPPAEFQHWMAVEDRMREESLEEAELLMKDVADTVYNYCGVHPEVIIRQGQPKEELQKFIDEEEDLFALFLGADTEGDPGPLVTYFSGRPRVERSCPSRRRRARPRPSPA